MTAPKRRARQAIFAEATLAYDAELDVLVVTLKREVCSVCSVLKVPPFLMSTPANSFFC